MPTLFLKPASNGLYHHSYDPMTITTMDFNQPQCSRVIECVPTDKWTKIHGSGEMQLAPQVFPPYGRLYFRTAAFFVPEHQIFSASEAFHANQTMYKGRSYKLPVFNLYECLNVACSSNVNGILVDTVQGISNPTSPANDYPSPDDYDFMTIHRNGTTCDLKFWKLTATGYRYYSFFKSLGYDFVSIPWPYDLTVPSGYADIVAYLTSINTFVNRADALALLSFAKVYADYFMPGQFFNGHDMVKLLQSVHDIADFSSYYNATTGELSALATNLIYDTCKTPVMQDMFTKAWNSPNSPLGTFPSDYGVPNNGSLISPYISQSNNNRNDTIINSSVDVVGQTHTNNGLISLSSFGLRIQKAFEQFVIRNNLVGTRPVQRTLARFGRKPSDATSHFVSKLYEGSDLIKFHPVLSNSPSAVGGTTDVDKKGLGDIAGFSKAAFEFSFDYECSDYGMIIVMHWLQIKPIVIHGRHPHTMRINPFDFFTPEYDGQAMRVIPQCELSVLKDNRTSTEVTASHQTDDDIYGFVNMYDDMREMRDTVSGDFLNGFTKDFFFGRDYSLHRSKIGYTFKPQSNDVQLMSGGGFTQPFQIANTDGDRFWLGIQFDIEAERPIKSNSDALMLNGSGDTEVPMNGTLNS